MKTARSVSTLSLGLVVFASTFITGCSTTQKYGLIANEPPKTQAFQLSSAEAKPFRIKDCAARFLLLPIDRIDDLDAQVKDSCPGQKPIFDYSYERTGWEIPILYGKMCIEVAGKCGH